MRFKNQGLDWFSAAEANKAGVHCARCGSNEDQPLWADKYCQECWEYYTGKAYWRAVYGFDLLPNREVDQD